MDRVKTSDDISKVLSRSQKLYLEGKYDDALTLVNKIIDANASIAPAYFLFGLISLKTQEYFMAEQAFKYTINLDEKMASAWANLAKVFAMTYQLEGCSEALEETLLLQPQDPQVWIVLGQVYQKLGQVEQANIWLSKAATAFPDAVDLHITKIFNDIYMGDLETAKATTLHFLKKHPAQARLHYALSRMEAAKDSSHIKTMEALRGQNGDSLSEQFHIHYALGKEYEDIEDWDKAFSSFEAGAAARRQTVEFDEAEQEAFCSYLKETLNQEWLTGAISSLDSAGPIFVIGLPRTGTTLVERILSAHSKVQTAGETQYVTTLVRDMCQGTAQEPMSLTNLNVQTFGERYLRAIESAAQGAAYCVDKLPQNFYYLPIIAAAFPNAKFIHLRRNPMDSCFSNYKQLFAETYHHSYDQGEMARHYVRYHDLMATWRALLPDRIFDVDYESLVQDTPSTAKALIEHLGLDWEEGCLDFQNQRTAVVTASASQVRGEVHTRSINRWQRYEKQLEPMFEILKDHGLV